MTDVEFATYWLPITSDLLERARKRPCVREDQEMFECESGAGPGPLDQASVMEMDRADEHDQVRQLWSQKQGSTGTLLFHRPVRWVLPE